MKGAFLANESLYRIAPEVFEYKDKKNNKNIKDMQNLKDIIIMMTIIMRLLHH